MFCFVIILRGKFLFYDNFVRKVLVLCQFCGESVCFVTILRGKWLIFDNFARKLFVLSQCWEESVFLS